MSKFFKILTTSLIVASFLGGSMMLCCLKHLKSNPKVPACCHKADTKHSSKGDCGKCPSILKNTDSPQTFESSAAPVLLAPVSLLETMTVARPVHVLKSIYANGPPGPRSAVPLFLLTHAFRL